MIITLHDGQQLLDPTLEYDWGFLSISDDGCYIGIRKSSRSSDASLERRARKAAIKLPCILEASDWYDGPGLKCEVRYFRIVVTWP